MRQQNLQNLKRSSGSSNERKLETVEIDFVEAIKRIKDNRKILYKSVLIFLILGLIVAFGSKVEYEASCKLLPEKREGTLSNLGGLSGFVGITGINLDFGSQSTIAPELYPQIVESLPFQLKLVHEKIAFERRDTTLSSYTYFKEIDSPSWLGYIKEYTLGLPEKIRQVFSDDSDAVVENEDGNISRLSKKDFRLIEKFKNRVYVDSDPETGLISIEAEMPDPVAAAELTRATTNLLLQRIIDHKINKVSKNLKFIKERYTEAKAKFELAQRNLENISPSASQTDRQRLKDEYDIALETYKGLTAQLDAAELKVEEETPVFTVVEPVNVPVDKSKPKRTVILAISVFLGLLAGSVIALFK